jgi:hypothetical protein
MAPLQVCIFFFERKIVHCCFEVGGQSRFGVLPRGSPVFAICVYRKKGALQCAPTWVHAKVNALSLTRWVGRLDHVLFSRSVGAIQELPLQYQLLGGAAPKPPRPSFVRRRKKGGRKAPIALLKVPSPPQVACAAAGAFSALNP